MLQPGDHLERYEVVQPLGHGGHASVYLLKHQTLGSMHALKVLSLPRPDLRERLIQEGRIQANLSHPNIVPVTDILDVHGIPALLMPYVDGPELGEWIQRRKPLDTEEVASVFSAIVSAVAAAHDRGLVHRDLKPGNILMAGQPGDWQPRITDFGIAKIVMEDRTGDSSLAGDAIGLTRTGMGLGTPAYMAPEQVANAASVDRRADVFALGCILHEMVAGRRLFVGSHPLHVAAHIASSEPADLRAVPHSLPAPLVAALCGCVEKSLEARIPDCAVLLEVLRGERSWEHAPLPEPEPDSTSSDPPAGRPTLAPTGTPLIPLQAAPQTPAQPLAPPPLQQAVAVERPRPSGGLFGALALGTAVIAGGAIWLSDGPPPDRQAPSDRVPRAAARPPAVASPAPPPPSQPAGTSVDAVEAAAADASPPTEREAPAETPPSEPAPPRVERPAPTPQTGTLELNTLPASLLFVDDKAVGHGGTELSLPAGVHTIRFRNEATGVDYSQQVDVPGNERVFVCYDFDLKKPC